MVRETGSLGDFFAWLSTDQGRGYVRFYFWLREIFAEMFEASLRSRMPTAEGQRGSTVVMSDGVGVCVEVINGGEVFRSSSGVGS